MNKLTVIYDDSSPAPAPVRDAIGVERFGDIIFQRRSLRDAMNAAVLGAGLPDAIHIQESAEWDQIAQRLNQDEIGGNFLICPSNAVATCGQDALITFLQQAVYAPANLLMPVEANGRPGWLLMNSTLFKVYVEGRQGGDLSPFFEAKRHEFAPIGRRLGLADLSEEQALLNLLSGTFDVRHFNAIVWEGYTITKRSTDGAKLRREFDFYDLLPPSMQTFFLRPFDFEEQDGVAQYQMERLFFPDMAVQWLQGGYGPDDFDRFLSQVFNFIGKRTSRSVSRDDGRAKQQYLYVQKLLDRVADLKALPIYTQIQPEMNIQFGSIDALVERYLKLFDKWRDKFPLNQLVIGHGDLCFSNILYSKTNHLMRLIDARGVSGVDELYTDPYYDLAKLSHSVLGNYDAINQELFEITLDNRLKLTVNFDRCSPAWAEDLFIERLTRAGYDPVLTRLAEASLFLSMLPLHADRPRKVLAFALNAADILSELERA